MLFTQTYDLERYWLSRRIAFIEHLDELIQNEADYDEMYTLASEFRQVERPSDVIDRLKDVYGSSL